MDIVRPGKEDNHEASIGSGSVLFGCEFWKENQYIIYNNFL